MLLNVFPPHAVMWGFSERRYGYTIVVVDWNNRLKMRVLSIMWWRWLVGDVPMTPAMHLLEGSGFKDGRRQVIPVVILITSNRFGQHCN